MKVFLVIPTLSAGGAERVMSVLANNWINKKDLSVEILLLADGERFYELDAKVKVTYLGFKTNRGHLLKLLSLFRLSIKFRTYVRQNQSHFVLSFMTKNNIFTLLSLYGLKVKCFVSEREGPAEVVPWIRGLLRKYTYHLADGVICQTAVGKEFILNETRSKNVAVIPNPIKGGRPNQTLKRENIILNVGRLVAKKGQKYLIEAFSTIKPGLEKWQLVFLGDGPLKNDLIQYAESLGIEDKVLFMGSVKDVGQWYRKSAIFGFPSTLEGYPNALAEAMCNGLACASFDCSTGPSEIIDDGVNGFLIEERNVSELADKLQLLMTNEALRVRFSEEAVKLNDVLDEKLITDRYYNFCRTS